MTETKENLVASTVRIPEDLHRAVTIRRAQDGEQFQWLVIRLLTEWLGSEAPPPPEAPPKPEFTREEEQARESVVLILRSGKPKAISALRATLAYLVDSVK